MMMRNKMMRNKRQKAREILILFSHHQLDFAPRLKILEVRGHFNYTEMFKTMITPRPDFSVITMNFLRSHFVGALMGLLRVVSIREMLLNAKIPISHEKFRYLF